jgi:hypothetical protein
MIHTKVIFEENGQKTPDFEELLDFDSRVK